MNDLLHLKGSFEQKKHSGGMDVPKLPAKGKVTISHLNSLKDDLNRVLDFWMNQNIIADALVTVEYIKIVAKSNRISKLLSSKGKKSNDAIVGARYSNDKRRHLIVYNVDINTIRDSISMLIDCSEILKKEFFGTASDRFNEEKTYLKIDFKKYKVSKTVFRKVIVDAFYTSRFYISTATVDYNQHSLITLYKTSEEIEKVLKGIGIEVNLRRKLDETTFLLDIKQIEILNKKAPFLVAMAVNDISILNDVDSKETKGHEKIYIPSPGIEPTIGVIDTLFDPNVYFQKWVEVHNLIGEGIEINDRDYSHATGVTSIIVDGPSLNPDLDDGCGRFKVRHFGICLRSGFSSFNIIKKIQDIISENKDIKVWNISLGSEAEINDNYISAEAAALDQIQFENDVIFIISGTNNKHNNKVKKIGSPADSINSLVVNSVDFDGNPSDYTRVGYALSFFLKPDVSYYGGSIKKPLIVYEPNGISFVAGTSYVAPWIARKMSYLIDILGFSREIAKALIIDSAISYNKDYIDNKYLGHGVVPINIKDIVNAKKDEIKFVLSGISLKYDTYNYRFPIPVFKGAYPFIAKATLCYFPKCSKNQGVDYTNTEFDFYFGRLNQKGKIKAINNNMQSPDNDEEIIYINEDNARKHFRKWDNVKHIREYLSPNNRPRKVLNNNKLWGMSIKIKERLNTGDGVGIKYGVVVTLKEINGVNRIEEFIQMCYLNGWLVKRINVEQYLDIYQRVNEDIELE